MEECRAVHTVDVCDRPFCGTLSPSWWLFVLWRPPPLHVCVLPLGFPVLHLKWLSKLPKLDVCLLTLQLALHLFETEERVYIFLWVLLPSDVLKGLKGSKKKCCLKCSFIECRHKTSRHKSTFSRDILYTQEGNSFFNYQLSLGLGLSLFLRWPPLPYVRIAYDFDKTPWRHKVKKAFTLNTVFMCLRGGHMAP